MTKKKNMPIIPPKEHVYLEGPKSRSYELSICLESFQAIYQRISEHFILLDPALLFLVLHDLRKNNFYYDKAREFGKRIAELGFTTMTGGGPGIMEAANRGAFENGGAFCRL